MRIDGLSAHGELLCRAVVLADGVGSLLKFHTQALQLLLGVRLVLHEILMAFRAVVDVHLQAFGL